MEIENRKLKIIFFGTPKDVVSVLESLVSQFDVVAVVTAPDQKAGRKQLLTPSPVKVAAQKHTIPVFQPKNLSELPSQFLAFNPQLFVVAAYGKIIPSKILQIAQYGAINIHPSLLPKYRGSTPIQTTLLNGDQTSGVTFIKMDEKMDHGPILHQIPFTLEKTDTFGWLMQSMFSQAAIILPHVIEKYISGKTKLQSQDDRKAIYTKIITKQDGYIDLETSPSKDELDRRIRAYFPWPTVWTKIKMKDLELRIKLLPDNQLQVEGKNPMSLKDFLNGYPEMKEIIKKMYLS
jgi:methionyl-tRNA formyltransferase